MTPTPVGSGHRASSRFRVLVILVAASCVLWLGSVMPSRVRLTPSTTSKGSWSRP